MSTPRPDDPGRRRRRESLLRDRRFLRLWAATTAAGLATWALPFVLGLAVLEDVLSGTALGAVLAARTVGFLVAVPTAGVLADRISRHMVIQRSALLAVLASALLALGLGTSTPLMLVAATLAGAGQGGCRPAFQALTAEVVTVDRRQQANAAMTLAVRVTTTVGPGLAALLALVLGVRGLLIGIAALWLVVVLAPAPVMPSAASSGRSPGFVTDFKDGAREARRHPWFVLGLAALACVIATGYSATAVALPLISRDRYHSEAVLAGAMTAYTAGALLGALVLARWQPRSQGWVALASLAAYGLAPLALLLPTHSLVVCAAYVVVGVGIELFNVPWFTAIQREVAPDKLARVSSLDFLVAYGLAPLGLALIAPAITTFGIEPVLAACAAACVLAPAAAALHRSSRHFSVGAEARTTSR